jgi:RNA polymerase sigma factor (sigma-70 family)
MADDAFGPLLRHAYGRVVAQLLREFGATRLAQVEDGLAQAMLEATLAWRARGIPQNATAWLQRAARNRIIDELRRGRFQGELPETEDESQAVEPEAPSLTDEIHDDELRALLACASPDIPEPSQIVFALRTLCGFSTREIANRLVTSEENVQKRWERAREAMRTVDLEPTGGEWSARVQSVLRMIYVLFTEGYFASGGPTVLRLELCQEALRLAHLVAHHPRVTTKSAWALVALLHLHHARRDARTDAEGSPILLEAQDRNLYRRDELAVAMEAFQRAGQMNSKYHLEAAIAAEHAFAPTFEVTRWPAIVALYERLARLEPSPLHHLHGAIARSYAEGPAIALAQLKVMRPPTWLSGSHLWLATFADFHRRLGELEEARSFYEQADALAPTFERAVLTRQLAACLPPGQ